MFDIFDSLKKQAAMYEATGGGGAEGTLAQSFLAGSRPEARVCEGPRELAAWFRGFAFAVKEAREWRAAPRKVGKP